MTDRLLTGAELAELLNVSPHWVRRHTTKDGIPHVKLGKYSRYQLSRVEVWLQDQERGGGRGRRRATS